MTFYYTFYHSITNRNLEHHDECGLIICANVGTFYNEHIITCEIVFHSWEDYMALMFNHINMIITFVDLAPLQQKCYL